MAAVPHLRLCRPGMNKAFLLNGNGARLHGNQHSRFEAAIYVWVSGIGIGGGPGGGDAGVDRRTLRKTQLLSRCATQGSRWLTSEDFAAVCKSSPPSSSSSTSSPSSSASSSTINHQPSDHQQSTIIITPDGSRVIPCWAGTARHVQVWARSTSGWLSLSSGPFC